MSVLDSITSEKQKFGSSTLCSFVLLESSSSTLLGGIHVTSCPITAKESIFIFFGSFVKEKCRENCHIPTLMGVGEVRI